MKQLLLAVALSALASLAAAADTAGIMDAVPGHDVSYFDLMRQVIPDLTAEGDAATGHVPEGIGHIEGDEALGELPELATIVGVETVTIRAAGKPMLFVLADLGAPGNIGNYTLLAVFDETAQLVDAREVDTDLLTGFVGAPFAISPGDDAMLIGSEHHNSSQSYQSRQLVFLRDGRLQLIDTLFAFGTRSCDFWQTEELSLATMPADAAYWTIAATITRNRAPAGPDCADPADADWRHDDFTATYSWDSVEQRYSASRAELDTLAREDEALF